jgi:hypothetical protein
MVEVFVLSVINPNAPNMPRVIDITGPVMYSFRLFISFGSTGMTNILKTGTFLKIEFDKASDNEVEDLKRFTEILFDPKTLRIEEDKHDEFSCIVGRVAHDLDVSAVMGHLTGRFATMTYGSPYTEKSVYGKGQGQKLSLHMIK